MALITDFYINGDVVVVTVTVEDTPFKVAYFTGGSDGGPEFIQAIQDHTEWLQGVNYFDGVTIINVALDSSREVWDWPTKSWVYALTLEEARAKKWASIKKSRTEKEFSDFIFNGHTYDGDETSQRRISGAVSLAILADDTFSIDWTVEDNTTVTLTRNLVIGLGVSLAGHVGSAHKLSRGKRLLIESATTIEEVEAVIW